MKNSLDYYISRRGQAALAKKHDLNALMELASYVIQISSKVKAMFVFQAPEFCNGSQDRMKVIDFTKIRASIMRKCKLA